MNDLSVQGQFASVESFIESLKDLLRLRRFEFIRTNLYCSRAVLCDRIVHGAITFATALRTHSDRDFKQIALSWLNKYGPFLEDDRQNEPDDYFQYAGVDVTEQGLGEAARRVRIGNIAGTFSFPGGPVNFELEPLRVQHGLDEEPLGIIAIPNVWQFSQLKARALAARRPAEDWKEFFRHCSEQFEDLLIASGTEHQMRDQPFTVAIRKGIGDLLSVLQEFMENRSPDGATTDRGQEILQTFFVGRNAWFSDESKQNKVDFRNAMTFLDPEDSTRRIACFWHGKIQTPQIRIHFEWPVPAGQRKLKVVYIGPKISKR